MFTGFSHYKKSGHHGHSIYDPVAIDSIFRSRLEHSSPFSPTAVRLWNPSRADEAFEGAEFVLNPNRPATISLVLPAFSSPRRGCPVSSCRLPESLSFL